MNTSSQADQLQQQIISLLQDRNKRGITLLYEHSSPALYHIILRVTQSDKIAEEVLQDVFVKIWSRFDQFDGNKGRLFTWMAQIARNSAIDATRSGKFKRSQKTETLPDAVSNDERLSETPVTADSGLHTVISQLDEKYRMVIEYVYFKDYTHKETSEALDIPLGTVKSRVRAAVKTLRGILGDERTMIMTWYVLLTLTGLLHWIAENI